MKLVVQPVDKIRIAGSDRIALELENVAAQKVTLFSEDHSSARTMEIKDGIVNLFLGFKTRDKSNNSDSLALVPQILDLMWTDQDDNSYTTKIEVVSRHYFELSALRCLDTDNFSDKTDVELWAARQAATEIFEKNARRSFVKRMGSTRIYDNKTFIELDDCDVVEIITKDVTLVSDCQCRIDKSLKDLGSIKYIYGKDFLPTPVKNAVLTLAAYYLRDDVIPARAIGEATEAGFMRFTIAGRDGATGLPEVDAVIKQFGRRRYKIA